ncbi:MAG: PEP-CTERM sorting domain-containing protein, partial [bacterium]|nr:PEP-CTERM sorting domain-containing protein [bacterium]
NDVIRIVTAFSDASAAFPVVVDITITDNVGGSFTVFNVVTPPAIFFPATGIGLTEVAFTQFGTVDFTQVTGATFRFDTSFPATDYEFLFLGATEGIPEPGSLSLLGLGLLCLAASAYRRKRRLNQG